MAATIRLDRSSVQTINSGQVILDLQSAVKELLENSLDAGSSAIDIRLKEYGVDSIEIIDNGCGISAKDFESIGLRSHTSKLASFDALDSLATLGFRGEAFNSLCALANVSLSTATSESKTPVARHRGTTVVVTSLFSKMPVRRKDLERNQKREFAKVQDLLHAYALMNCNVKFSFSNQVGKKTKTVCFQTPGKGEHRAAWSAIYGSKSVNCMVDVRLEAVFQADKSVLKASGLEQSTTSMTVTGIISKPEDGSGRNTSDRQYLYINSRPFSHSKLHKAATEVYRNINPAQFPNFVLNFQLPSDAYDVNVSPDKRTILFHSELNFLEAFKTALAEELSPTFQKFDVAQHTQDVEGNAAEDEAAEDKSHSQEDAGGSSKGMSEDEQEDDAVGRPRKKPRLGHDGPDSELAPVRSAINVDAAHTAPKEAANQRHPEDQMATEEFEMAVDGEDQLESRQSGFRAASCETSEVVDDAPPRREALRHETIDVSKAFWNLPRSSEDSSVRRSSKKSPKAHDSLQPPLTRFWNANASQEAPSQVVLTSDSEEDQLDESAPSVQDRSAFDRVSDPESYSRRSSSPVAGIEDDIIEDSQPPAVLTSEMPRNDRRTKPLQIRQTDSGADVSLDSTDTTTNETFEETVQFDLRDIQPAWQALSLCASTDNSARITKTSTQPDRDATENAAIDSDALEAEANLSRIVEQSDFARMQVCGQFNLGFIIARRLRSDATRSEDDLFIIDQHASDEKYNFEELQKSTKLQSQIKLHPELLDLSVADEMIVQDNVAVFEANGFKLSIDKEADVGKRVSISGLPVSKTTTLGSSEFEEILHLLRDSAAGTIVRPAKVRAMFAMRACRMSVMIGKALPASNMKMILAHMGTMKQPWSCPHGRPTMRWLAHVEDEKETILHEKLDWLSLASDV